MAPSTPASQMRPGLLLYAPRAAPSAAPPGDLAHRSTWSRTRLGCADFPDEAAVKAKFVASRAPPEFTTLAGESRDPPVASVVTVPFGAMRTILFCWMCRSPRDGVRADDLWMDIDGGRD